MTLRRRRLVFLLSGLLALGLATTLVLSALEENLVFFYSPTDLQTTPVGTQARIRIGGLVEEGSLQRSADGMEADFRVTDLQHSLAVHYRGLLPDLFREGQGIVAEGHLQADGRVLAKEVLAKHDETYMPPAVAEALKKSGRWKEGTPE